MNDEVSDCNAILGPDGRSDLTFADTFQPTEAFQFTRPWLVVTESEGLEFTIGPGGLDLNVGIRHRRELKLPVTGNVVFMDLTQKGKRTVCALTQEGYTNE
jgi:hypothetical protein